jgi:hypothetical protein
MVETANNPKDSIIALLCASNDTTNGVVGASAMANILGQPLISRQIALLRDLGINHFIIAIDNLPGALLALADQMADLGTKVDFVRSPQELAEKSKDTEFLFIQAEGIMADRQLIEECLAVRSPYVATMDGREENRVFENIDLNTVWAGLALLPTEMTSKIVDLPDDWSIASSLLRQAVTQKIHYRPIPQNIAQSGALQLVQSAGDADAVGASLIAKQKSGFDGWIESKIFAPIAKRLFPFLQRSPSVAKIIDFAPEATALSALVLAAADYHIVSASFGILTLFMLSLRDLYKVSSPFSAPSKLLGIGSFILLTFAAAAVTARSDLADPRFGFVALIVAGLVAVANAVPLSSLSAQLLRSPALFAVTLLVGGAVFGPVWTVLAFAIFQISALLVGLRK